MPADWGDTVRAWVVYPERATRAPVVIVIHEIFGLTDWIRAVADQVAAEGFIAIAPDLLSGHGPPDGGGTPANRQEAIALVRSLRVEDVHAATGARSRGFGLSLPSASGRFGAVGFCWGGSTSFNFAANEGDLERCRGVLRQFTGKQPVEQGHSSGAGSLRWGRRPGERDDPGCRGA